MDARCMYASRITDRLMAACGTPVPPPPARTAFQTTSASSTTTAALRSAPLAHLSADGGGAAAAHRAAQQGRRPAAIQGAQGREVLECAAIPSASRRDDAQPVLHGVRRDCHQCHPLWRAGCAACGDPPRLGRCANGGNVTHVHHTHVLCWEAALAAVGHAMFACNTLAVYWSLVTACSAHAPGSAIRHTVSPTSTLSLSLPPCRHVIPPVCGEHAPAEPAGASRPHCRVVLRRCSRRAFLCAADRVQQRDAPDRQPLPLLQGHGLPHVWELHWVWHGPGDQGQLRVLHEERQGHVHRVPVHRQEPGDGA
eukprot:364092-Chlamydomonas_euryale.AAC.7